jgi:microcystin-dependent protein
MLWKTMTPTRRVSARVAATALLLGACSTLPTQDDGGRDAIAADGDASTATDAATRDVGSDAAPTLDAPPETRDASNDDGATAPDATLDAPRDDATLDAPRDASVPDGTGLDGAPLDAPRDAGAPDASPPDATATDATATDAIATDATATDAIATDATATDAIATDATATDARDAIAESGPDVTCPSGQTSCAGRCVDPQTDLLNCGACGTVCPPPPSGTTACIAGRCGAVPGSRTTQPAGAAVALPLGQPSLALTMVVATAGTYPTRDGSADAATIGMVHLFAGNFGPDGAPLAAGQLVPIASNAALFSLLGGTFGGDGRVTFALPDLRERTLVGTGAGAGLPAASLGVVFGSAAATLTLGTMPTHSHLLMDGATRTSAAGRSEPFDLSAPSLPLTAWVATQGVFPTESGGAPSPFLGEIRWFAGNFTPTRGWAPADGRRLSIATNTALFAVIGTTFGGDGRTTFAVPDLRGRAPVGWGAAPGRPTIALGESLGASSTTLIAAQLPTHAHELVGGGATQPSGESQPVAMYQPSLGITWLIATQGLFPSRDGSGEFDLSDPYVGEVIAFAGNFAPRGYLKAEGQTLTIATNTALFALLGTTFGGDGRTTFALPDLRGRAPIGTSPSTPVGAQRGAPTRTLVTANLPPHTHMY